MSTSGGGAPVIEGFSDLVEIGHGGFSVVYSATQVAFGRPVAIKVLDVSGTDARRIEREARALGQLADIPHIVQAYAALSTADGRPALVMSLMEASLGSRIRSTGAQPVEVTIRLLDQLAGALDEAHRRDVHHRDIKPENVLLSANGDAYLADFGIAALGDLSPSTTTVFSLSPQHASPERLSDDEQDPRAGDIYSLASTVYTALSGRPPFGTAADGGLHGLVTRVVNDPVPELAGAPLAVQEVFRRAMAKRPEDRFVSAGEFADALSLAYSGPSALALHDPTIRRRQLAVPSHPVDRQDDQSVTGDGRTDAPPVRRRTALAASGVVTLLLVAGAVFAWSTGGGTAAEGASTASDGRARLISFLEEGADRHPEGFLDCVADRIASDVDDVGGYVDAFEAELAADPEYFPEGDAYLDSERRHSLRNAAELVCASEVLDIGTTVTVEGPATDVVVNAEHACALMETGRVACWGSNWEDIAYDEDGFGPDHIDHPVLTGPDDVVDVDLGGWSSRCIVRADGTAACNEIGDAMGWNGYMYSADGPEPEPFPGMDDFVRISSGDKHVCAVRATGAVMCRGDNSFGQLGDGTRTTRDRPVPVNGVSDVTDVAAGFDHTCALRRDGSVACWGITGVGLDWHAEPRTVDGLPPIEQLAVGQAVSCGLDRDGGIWCWGNLMSMLGDPDADGSVPHRVLTDAPMATLDVGGTEACAASRGEGEVFCWGDGRPQPRKVEMLYEVTSLAVTSERTCAVSVGGFVECWGPKAGPLSTDADAPREPTRLEAPTSVEGLGAV